MQNFLLEDVPLLTGSGLAHARREHHAQHAYSDILLSTVASRFRHPRRRRAAVDVEAQRTR
jgi:hypothetical protein